MQEGNSGTLQQPLLETQASTSQENKSLLSKGFDKTAFGGASTNKAPDSFMNKLLDIERESQEEQRKDVFSVLDKTIKRYTIEVG